MQWKMDSNNSYGGFGENFLEDFMNSSSEVNHLAPSSESQGVDILQQSLKAADILDNNNATEDISFDDFGFSLGNDSYNQNAASTSYSFPPENQTTSSAELYMPQLSESSLGVDEDLFDAEQFLSASSTVVTSLNANNSIQSGPYIKSTAPIITQQQNTVAYQETPSLVLPTVIQSPSIGSLSQKVHLNSQVSQPRQSLPFQVSVAAKPSTLISRQTNTNSVSNVAHSFQNTQYVASTGGTIPQYNNNSYTVCTGTSLQTNSTTVSNSIFTRSLNQPNSTPVIVNVNPSVIRVGANSSSHLNNVASPTQPLQAISVASEQVNKLALMLQNKAAQQTGPSNNPGILRVGNQSINISDPAVAKALATKILEQKMKQYSQNQPQHNTSTSQSDNIAQNRVVSIATLPNKAVVINNSQQLQPQIKTQYVISAIPQTSNAPVQNSFIQLGRPTKTVQLHPAVNTVVQPKSTLTQLSVTKSGSPVPINRIQIASVNIPLTSNQINVINTSSVRSSVPVQGLNVTPNDKKNVFSLQPASRSVVPVQTLPMTIVTAASSSNKLMQQLGTNLKLNLTPQQTSSLSRDQLQQLLLQHQAAIRARRPKVPPTTTTTEKVKVTIPRSVTVTSVAKPKIVPSSQPSGATLVKVPATKFVSFRVDPNLTWPQVEEVQQLIAQKLPLSKISPLTKEQKQLLAAFRAHLRSMDPPIQQYYLRNPQFFLQKVYHHLQTGKPFMIQAKIDLTSSIKSGTTALSVTSAHPTISLSTDAQRNSSNGVKLNHTLTPTSVPMYQRRAVKRAAVDSLADVNSAQPTVSKRPSLIMEQLQKHRDIATHPNTETPFQTVRDACRRLLPYHVYNMPQIEEEPFVKSEPLFDQISDNLVSKMETMLNKYHMLCLKDAAREVCAADVVMLERCFLQHERAMFVELKGKLKDDSSAIGSFLSPQHRNENPHVVSYLKEQQAIKEGLYNFENPSQLRNSSYELSDSNNTASVSIANNMQDGEIVECEVVPMEAENEMLLQEAVESILS